MRSALIHRFSPGVCRSRVLGRELFVPPRPIWDRLVHLLFMDRDQWGECGLERLLTTSELAEYLGLKVQAIYDLRTTGRGPVGIPVGRELRFRPSEVRQWLDRLRDVGTSRQGGER